MFNECTQRLSAPCAWSYETSILNKRNYITLPHKYSFLLVFFLSPPSKAHLWKDPLDFRVISIESQRNLPFPALNQGSQSIWRIIPRASKMRNKEKNFSAWNYTNNGKTLPTTLCPRRRPFFLDPLQLFDVQRDQSLAEALTQGASNPPFPFSLYFCSHIKASQPFPSLPGSTGSRSLS